MSVTRIFRGPMGGDQFTMLHNYVFRDTRLTPQAMAVFGHISTHANLWGTSIARIAESMNIGPGVVRSALACLKANHYVIQGQARDEKGRVGDSWYFVTDLPAQLLQLGISDSERVEMRVNEAFNLWQAENSKSEPLSPEAYRPRPAETRPKRVYPKSLQKNRRSDEV